MYESSRKEIKINESTFFVRRFPAFVALSIGGDLQSRFLQPLLPALEGANGNQEEIYAAVMKGVGELSQSLSGKELVALAKSLLQPDYIACCPPGVHPSDAVKLDESMHDKAFESAADVVELCVEVAKLNFLPVFNKALTLLGRGN